MFLWGSNKLNSIRELIYIQSLLVFKGKRARAHLHDPVGAAELEHERIANKRRAEPTLERLARGRGDRSQVARAPQARQTRVELHDRRRERRHVRHMQTGYAAGDCEKLFARALQHHRVHMTCNEREASSWTVGVSVVKKIKER